MTRPALEARNVSRTFGRVEALKGVSLTVRQGECLALVGESGSGKTTLLRMFNRMVIPDAGDVLVEGEDSARVDPIQLRRRIGYVQQQGGLMPHWRVLRNVGLVPSLTGATDVDALARRALDLVGLPPEEFGDRWPAELSGGQRQRVALARALANHPNLLLLDEPFGALDAITRAEIRLTFAEVRSALGTAAVLVTHDLREACELADRIVVLRSGTVEQSATPDELIAAPETTYVATLVERSHLSAGMGL